MYKHRHRSMESILKELKRAHPSLLENVQKKIQDVLKLSNEGEDLEDLSLDGAYRILGKVHTRLNLLDSAAKMITSCLSRGVLSVKCAELESLREKVLKQMAIVQELILSMLHENAKQPKESE